MNAQEQAWASSFGDAYTCRNRVDWRARIPFWRHIIEVTGARSVYELGCNAGWNLSAIRRAFPDVKLWGSDINETAIEQAGHAGLDGVFIGDDYDCMVELSFTCGVLIHIPPEELTAKMQMLVDMSSDYVLALEYASESGNEEPVTYRGQENMLWRRDYGKLYQDMGLMLIESGDPQAPWERCTYWLLRKDAK